MRSHRLALILLLSQLSVAGSAQSVRDPVSVVLERASKESNVDGAGLVLSSLLSDEAAIRSALSTREVPSERSAYILFGGNWGSRAGVTREKRSRWFRILVDSVSAKPLLIRSVIRADRYDAYITRRHPIGSGGTLPFFSTSRYADDTAEFFIERLRRERGRPPTPILIYNHVAVTAEDHEIGLLFNWQMLCGLCDRSDLIDKATVNNWRGRFPQLDKWFQENRPYILWDDTKSCIRIDDNGKEWGLPTERTSRFIAELKPPWLSD